MIFFIRFEFFCKLLVINSVWEIFDSKKKCKIEIVWFEISTNNLYNTLITMTSSYNAC